MYNYCSPTQIKPTGWLRRQLEIQAAGLAGNLDLVWPDVRDSAWIGGNKEGWERVPYWLDGFIPLAYLLEDEELIARANHYVDAILDRRADDGWLCPCSLEERDTYDIWAAFLIGKVLALYCEFTASERAEKALYDAMKCLHTMDFHLFDWGKFRWFECFIPLQYLYDRYPEDWIPELARKLYEQGAHYEDYLDRWKRPVNQWTFETHIVNLGMMLKAPAVYKTLLGEDYPYDAESFWQILNQYNGMPAGIFSGDECLSGLHNNQGAELCSVVELMYSFEALYAITGNPVWMERLEKAAYNALPATNSDDMWTHQYDQMTNQIACMTFPGKSFFRTNNSDAHLFGLEPNFGCCTANMGQGWPKLAMSTFLHTSKGIELPLMLPASLSTTINGVAVTIRMETEYPFRHSCRYIVETEQPVAFELKIRIPAWAKEFSIDTSAELQDGYYLLNRTWESTASFEIVYTDEAHFVERPYELAAVEYGPLLFALPIDTEYRMLEYERDGVERKFPYCDYELIPQSEWRYGFCSIGEVTELDGDNIPFSSEAPRLAVSAKMVRVDWDYADGYTTVADYQPVSRNALDDAVDMTLIPYGCAKLRMTEMPVIE